jgi:hypothetical protein
MKKETLEEVAEKYAKTAEGIDIPYQNGLYYGFVEGAKWMAERMYSEEEVIELLTQRSKHFGTKRKPFQELLLKQDLEWFKQFKKVV